MKNKKGFTLIELLVVVAIIALISGLVIIRIGGVAKDARISRRKSDYDNIKKAIDIFKVHGGAFIIPLNNTSYQLSEAGSMNSLMFNKTYDNKYPNNFLPNDKYLHDPLDQNGLCYYTLQINTDRTYCIKGTTSASCASEQTSVPNLCDKID